MGRGTWDVGKWEEVVGLRWNGAWSVSVFQLDVGWWTGVWLDRGIYAI